MRDVLAAAAALRTARLMRSPRAPFTDGDPALDEQWGYQVQDEDRVRRLAQGQRVVGAKLGLTSRAKQVTMGVHRPIVGFLTDAMAVSAGDDVFAHTAQPRIEPEITFRLGGVLDRRLTLATATDAVAIRPGVAYGAGIDRPGSVSFSTFTQQRIAT